MLSVTRIDVARLPCTFTSCAERHEVFAPSWELLHAWKYEAIPWPEYTRRYLAEMRVAYAKDAQPFLQMAQRLHSVEFMCWCFHIDPKSQQCHRHLLRDLLTKVAGKGGG